MPPNTTESFALFTLQEVDFDPFEIEAGARYERTDRRAAHARRRRGRSTASRARSGFAYSPAPGVRLGLNGSRAARAPSAEELFANGPHVATQQFEIGNPALGLETALGRSRPMSAAAAAGPTSGVNVYRTWFDDFVYLAGRPATEIDDLPVYRQLQQGADHFGIEAEAERAAVPRGRLPLRRRRAGRLRARDARRRLAGAADPAAEPARRARGAVRRARCARRSAVVRRAGPHRRVRDPDRRLRPRQPVAGVEAAARRRQRHRDAAGRTTCSTPRGAGMRASPRTSCRSPGAT